MTRSNALAALHFAEMFDRTEVYQFTPDETDSDRKETVSLPLRGRLLFDSTMTYPKLTARFKAGAKVKTTTLTEQFDYDTFQALYDDLAITLFLITGSGDLKVFKQTMGLLLNPMTRLLVSWIQISGVRLSEVCIHRDTASPRRMSTEPKDPRPTIDCRFP
jgi:hypothetical protein